MKRSSNLSKLKKMTLVVLLSFGFAGFGWSQTATVSGRVTSEEGEPLIGATVLEAGTGNGTVTDFDGNYSLQLGGTNASLDISYTGYEPQSIPVNNRSRIDVTLATSSKLLDEVVVIGYGTQSKATVTSAISTVDAAEMENTTAINPVQALQGKVAGVDIRINSGQPGAGADFIIRGGTSLSPSSDGPLIIVDGVIRSMSDLNPNDIESIQILKDAASTAIYGARGANGIVLITTKSGGSEDGTGRITFSYSNQYDKQIRYFPYTTAEDYISVSRRAAALNLDHPNSSSRLTGGSYPYSTGNINNLDHGGGYGNSRHTLEFLDDLVADMGQEYVNDKLNNEGYQTMIDPITGREMIFLDNNYEDIMRQTGVSNNYDIGFSGGGKNLDVYSSFGYADQQGAFNGTFYKRASFLLNANYQASERVKVSAGVNYQIADYKGVLSEQNTLRRSRGLPHSTRLYYDDGTPAIGEGAGSPRNLLHELYYEDYTNERHRTTVRLGLDWEILDGLHFQPAASLTNNEFFFNYFERYHDFDRTRSMSSDHLLDRDMMFDGIFNYYKSFGGHNLNVMVGMNLTDNFDYDLRGSGRNAPTDYILTLNASLTEDERVSSYLGTDRFLSYFGRINYDLNQKYLFSVSARYDGSSRFTEENQFAFFPAVSAGWNVHYEDFWNISWISRLKLRSSWGKAGNNVLNILDTQGQYGSGYNYTWNAGILNTRLANSSLVWETTQSFDLGAEMGFLNNRFGLSVGYYNKLTTDKLTSIPLAYQTGFTSILANYGTIRNRGLEVELRSTPINSNGFRWNLDFNFSFNRLTVVDLPDNGEIGNRIYGGEIYDKASGQYIKVGGYAEGERIGGIWAFNMLGVYDNDAEAANAPWDTKVSGYWLSVDPENQKVGGDANWEDVDGNGIIDDRDQIFMGYAAPDKVGGIVNTFSWKGFSLRFVMDYALGHVISNGWRARANGNARNRVMTVDDVVNGNVWWAPGDDAQYPRYSAASDFDNGKRNHVRGTSYPLVGPQHTYSYGHSAYISKGDFLAFRQLALSYRLPSSIAQKLRLQNLDLQVTGNNLGYLTAYDGISPEHYNGGESGEYYRPTQLIFGVKATY